MKLLSILSIGMLLSLSACTNDNGYFQESSLGEELTVETTNLEEDEELSPELYVLFTSLFSEANTGKQITARFALDKKTGQRIVTTRVDTELNTIPMLKTRTENGREWIHWGKVCGLISAKKFVNFLEEKFEGVPYETRFEPIEGEDCREAYYRKG